MRSLRYHLSWIALLLVISPIVRATAEVTPDMRERVRAAEQHRIDVFARAEPSVVCIFDKDRGGGGAGVIITEDGYGLTNYHVVAGMLDTRQGLGGLSDGKLYPLEVLGIDPTGDVAMFRLSGREHFTPAPLGDSDSVHLGDWVFAMGNPFMLAEDYTPTVTHGIVSGVHRYQFGAAPGQLVYTDCIQVDASINPGNSGGPLFDMDGRVIGINGRASFEHRGRVNVGIGYAISVNQIKRFIPGLRAGLLTYHGSLGATVTDAGYHQVIFEKVADPSIAEAAGIEVGDRLLRFAGRTVSSMNHFANMLGTYPADWPVAIEYEHNGEQHHRMVRLERLPVKLEQPYEVNGEINRAEARRVLEAMRGALGRRSAGDVVRYTVLRGEPAGLLAVQLADVWRMKVTEWPGDRGQCTAAREDGDEVKTYEYTPRSAEIRLPNDTLVTALPAEEDRLRLWLAAQRAILAPVNDESIQHWRHEGGDAVGPMVGDVLSYRCSDSEDILVTIDPITHRPVRVRYRSSEGVTPDRPVVELEIRSYQEINGFYWPQRIDTYVDGRLRWIEMVQDVKWEDSK